MFTFLPYSAYKIHHYFKKRKLKGKKEEEEEEEEEEEKKIKEKKEEERKKQAEKEYANFFTSDKKCSIIMESHIFYSLLSPDNKKDNCIEIIHLIKSFFRKKNIPCEFSPNIAIACLGNTINQEKENNKFLKQSIPSAALYIINSEALFKAKIREEVDPYKLYQFTQKTVSNHSLYCLVPLCFKNNKILIDQNKEFIIDNINLDYEDTINKNAKHTLDLKEPQIVIRQGLNIQEIESFIHFEKAAEEFD